MGAQLRVPRPPPLPRASLRGPCLPCGCPSPVPPRSRRGLEGLPELLRIVPCSAEAALVDNSSEPLSEFLDQWQELGRPLGSARARHSHPGKIDGVGSGAETLSASMAQVEAIVILGLLAGATASLWYAWRRWLQACPHCGWVVRRVHHGWLRCPRCHKQYAGRIRLQSH
jgi:hypothetical protein